MRCLRIGCVAALLALAIARPAAAQDFDAQKSRCESRDNPHALDRQVEGCTALIKSGRLSTQGLAMAYSNRGSAEAAQNQPARAITDYNEALRIDPTNAVAY